MSDETRGFGTPEGGGGLVPSQGTPQPPSAEPGAPPWQDAQQPPPGAGTAYVPSPPHWSAQPSSPPSVPSRTPSSSGGGPSLTRRAGAILLVLGLVAGGGIAFGVTRATNSSRGGSVTINIDNTPVHVSNSNASGVAQALVPAVPTVIARTGGTSASLGSGFVIGHNGSVSYIVTNNHVVSTSKDLHVAMPNGDNWPATLVGADSLDDLAVLSVPSGSLPTVSFGDSSQLEVGQPVVAIGSPLGNQSSVTSGVLSALHRTITAGGETGSSSELLQDVLQTDASINPGNSGGPLADVQGRVIGVNVAVAGSSSNIGYSIPSNLAKRVVQWIIAGEKVQHPFLGISYLDSIDAIETGKAFSGPGVLVTAVTAGTPAATAGFKVNDILVGINGVKIYNGQTLGGLIQDKNVGDKLTCTVSRGGQTLTLTPTLVERPGNL
jgi:putative serine protease PepD